jgi:hypothetical protein
LGLPSVSATTGAAVAPGVANAIGNSYTMGTDGYCNATTNAGTGFNTTQPGQNPGQEGGNTTTAIVVNDDQDSDPIRRTCAFNPRTGSEFVCSTYLDRTNTCSPTKRCPSGETCYGSECWGNSLGLVLPVLNAVSLGNLQYPTQPCTQTTTVNAPLVRNGQGALPNGLCPNGDTSVLNSTCYVPADAEGKPNCLATNSQLTPPLSNATSQAGSGRGPSPQNVDSRVFNKWIWDGVNIAKDDTNRPIYGGAFHRIHSTTPTLSAGAAACARTTGDDQTACLVTASPCSFAFAGKEAVAATGGRGVAIKVDGIPPVAACIQAFGRPGAYHFARKLYFGTVDGFDKASSAELALAKCEASATIVNKAINFEKFVPLPSTGSNAVNGGNPYCEDFNERLLCTGTTTNVNACTNNAAANLPTASTICGNGTVEAFEECDPAAPASTWSCNQTNGLPCSTTCRCT